MKHLPRQARRLMLSFALIAAFALPTSYASQPSDTSSDGDIETTRLEPRATFPDAPYGVDPVVTGPVSDAFSQRRKAAGCEHATWPNVPRLCYPG